MSRSRIVTQFTALFAVAFICLNASGVACLAYCHTFDIAAEKEHCPLQKLSEDCNKAKDRDNGSKAIDTSEGEIDCCPFTVSVVAAPVESSKAFIDTVAASPAQDLLSSPGFVASHTYSFAGTPYRGPPLDRRIDRLKHCIIRI